MHPAGLTLCTVSAIRIQSTDGRAVLLTLCQHLPAIGAGGGVAVSMPIGETLIPCKVWPCRVLHSVRVHRGRLCCLALPYIPYYNRDAPHWPVQRPAWRLVSMQQVQSGGQVLAWRRCDYRRAGLPIIICIYKSVCVLCRLRAAVWRCMCMAT